MRKGVPRIPMAFSRVLHWWIFSTVLLVAGEADYIPLLRRVGLSAAPADAYPDVLGAVRFVSRFPGGRGAVRELCDLILAARGTVRP